MQTFRNDPTAAPSTKANAFKEKLVNRDGPRASDINARLGIANSEHEIIYKGNETQKPFSVEVSNDFGSDAPRP
jgi:hypothetical protein